ncbi:MAG: SWIM zinc finger family protein [Deltaproteobacteria bacterium]|jgi:uncharacterized Zn finger protein|nr:SWIM zinc finger family protein [Deltaproteobacteria bacterium]
MWWNKPYVSVSQKRAKAQRLVAKLTKKKKGLLPVRISGRQIAESFWGKGWCRHFDSMADFPNRLARGRSYIINDAVCHLEMTQGRVFALVSGTELYEVEMIISPLSEEKWTQIKEVFRSKLTTMVDLISGRLSPELLEAISHPRDGLFPQASEISYTCSCPDWAGLCKHVAAVFYGIGNRLDSSPELIFKLRGVDPGDLLAEGVGQMAMDMPEDFGLGGSDLEALFGVEIDETGSESEQSAVKNEPRTTKLTLVPAPEAGGQSEKPATTVKSKEIESVGPKGRKSAAKPVGKSPDGHGKAKELNQKAAHKAPKPVLKARAAKPIQAGPQKARQAATKASEPARTVKNSPKPKAKASAAGTQKPVVRSRAKSEPDSKTKTAVPDAAAKALKAAPEPLKETPGKKNSNRAWEIAMSIIEAQEARKAAQKPIK